MAGWRAPSQCLSQVSHKSRPTRPGAKPGLGGRLVTPPRIAWPVPAARETLEGPGLGGDSSEPGQRESDRIPQVEQLEASFSAAFPVGHGGPADDLRR